MTTLPTDILSCLFKTALSYAKCSAGKPEQRACVIYSAKRKTIVSMGYQVDIIPPEYTAKEKLRWIDKGNLYAICTHAPTVEGAIILVKMGVKEVYFMSQIDNNGLKILKDNHITSTRLLYG